jgi:hypothetical protein
VTNQTFRGIKKIVEADAKTNLLDNFVRVFCIDIVFNGLSCIFAEVFWSDLDKVRNLGLRNVRKGSSLRTEDSRE